MYQDEHLLAVNKPAGMPSQPDPSGTPSLLDCYPQTSPVHRLDQPASGLVLLARTPQAASLLSQAFREHRLVKRYLARVVGTPPPEGELLHHLVHDARHNLSRAYDRERPRSKPARLRYRVVEAGERSLLEIELITGRHHQIRAQLAHLGHPIVNDVRYGAKRNRARGIALHAWRLELEHPFSHQPLALEAALPQPFFTGARCAS